LNEEQRLIARTVHDFAINEVLPVLDRLDAHDWSVVRALTKRAGELGFFGVDAPEAYGGLQLDKVTSMVVSEEMSQAASYGASFGAHVNLMILPLSLFGTDEQKKKYLPRLLTGEIIGAYCLSEPGSGSDALGAKCKAIKQADGSFVLNGEKTWITNGGVAEIAVVWARTEEGVRGFLVEKGTPGYSTSDIHGKLSMRASVTSSLAFSDCRVDQGAMLPLAKGLKGPLSCLTQARFGIGWGVLGAAMDCYETARAYSVTRKQFDDRPIASHQMVQEKLAWMITEITKGQLLALQCGRLKDQKKLEPAHVSMLKRNNVAIALECARLSRDLLGANGIMDEYPIMRHMCNLETVKTYEGTDHVHALVIGERVTGVAAYK